MFWAADKLDTREQADSTRQEHRKSPELQSSLGASATSRSVPPRELPAPRLVVDVVEETAFRHQQRVRLEWTFKTTERLHPSRDLALGRVASPQLAPVADLHVMGGFNDVGDVVARVYLLAIIEDFHLVLEAVVGLGGKVGSPSAGG